GDIDWDRSFIEGFVVQRTDPSYTASQIVPIIDQHSYTFNQRVPVGASLIVRWELEAIDPGDYSGTFSVYVGTASATQIVRIVVR
ncbi:MAG: hypothetical protein HYZ68_02005, partial [Chloroflexi bacterium]|nr:hypothetical protein [Chloroflexota bacterium]